MRITLRPPSQVSNRSRASALVGALVMVAIIGFSVGVMLLSANRSIRVSREKIMYEEAYQAAISGTHLVRAWLIDPDLMAGMTGGGGGGATAESPSLIGPEPVMTASVESQQVLPDTVFGAGAGFFGLGGNSNSLQGVQLAAAGGGSGTTGGSSGSSAQSKIEKLMEQANKMGQDILENYALADLTPAQTVAKWFPTAEGTQLADGRIVLFSGFPKNASGAIASLNRTKDGPNKNKSIFQASQEEKPNYVADLRITTIAPNESGNGALRRSSFVIESKGAAVYAGTKKERVVQQRVLVYPQKTVDPLLSTNEALILNGSYTFNGNSHALVNWAPALAKGDMKLVKFFSIGKKGNDYVVDAGNKVNAGRVTPNDGKITGVTDYWLKWMTGQNGRLLSGDTPLFSGLPSGISDFFTELYTGRIPGITPDTVKFAGGYKPVTSYTPPEPGSKGDPKTNPLRGLVDLDKEGNQVGSLVQGSKAVDERIDNFFQRDADPEALKRMAVAAGTYIKWSSAGYFVNSDNQALYVDNTGGLSPYSSSGALLRSVSQLSMTKLIKDKSGPVSIHSREAIPDRILYIDKPGQSVDLSGFFWKGIMYANCNIMGNGKGDADLYVKDPDQYQSDPFDIEKKRHTLEGVFLDGILIVNGTVNLGGNMTIYGTLATTRNLDLNGTPNIYYNSANGTGRMQKPTEEPQEQRVIAGRITEPDDYKLVWGGYSEN